MNFRLIANTAGYILWVEAGFLLLPMVVSLIYRDGCWSAFLLCAAICAAVGALLRAIKARHTSLQNRDGYAAVALAWVLLSLFGALPYVMTGAIPNYVDALFETASGLTTTGASVLTEIEHLPHSILFWRSQTQWMGGMGVLVLFLALMPHLGGGAVFLMNAESPGPIKSRIVPRLGDTAKILYCLYIGLTVAETIALRIAGMPFFDALNHAFTTLSTGGFSIKNTSVAAYNSPAIEWVIIAFTVLASINFSLMFLAIRGQFRTVAKSQELRAFLLITVVAVAAVCGNLMTQTGLPFSQAVRDAAFQVTTINSTTGYCTRDFALWPPFSQAVLVLLMLIGGCAGSTAGGVKVSRVLLQLKSLKRELNRIVHPNRVSVVTMDGQTVSEQAVSSALAFQVAYLLVLVAGALVVALDGMGITESLTASLSCVSNIGPAFGSLGPTSNFAGLNYFTKVVLSLEMLMGRLELMPLLVLLNPATWRNK
ncbi:MAG: TrkH family potassium uptake protein [Oscillospiraceae bacterium]|nr:TrkH family potassium uptake protein [Oscillospiraceae bacterium]